MVEFRVAQRGIHSGSLPNKLVSINLVLFSQDFICSWWSLIQQVQVPGSVKLTLLYANSMRIRGSGSTLRKNLNKGCPNLVNSEVQQPIRRKSIMASALSRTVLIAFCSLAAVSFCRLIVDCQKYWTWSNLGSSDRPHQPVSDTIL
jgi:hypothetical protein